jgi:uncharacterized protein (DUF952 family)
MAHIFHIATRSDWQQALETGSYTTSTRGRTLAEEGFIHASRREQVPGVHAAFYRDLDEELVLLTIDTSRLGDVEVRDEAVGDDTFPHIYGPLTPGAVVEVAPMNKRGGTDTFAMVMLKEMAKRMAIATVVMLAIAVVVTLASTWLGR